MSHLINLSTEPFSFLSPPEQELIKKHIEIQFFKKAEVIIKQGEMLDKIYIIYKGHIIKTNQLPSKSAEIDEQAVIAYYQPEDIFGFRMIDQAAVAHFVALEETFCFTLEAEIFKVVISSNNRFNEYFFGAMNLGSGGQNQPATTGDDRLASKISEFVLKKPSYIAKDAQVIEAARAMLTQNVNSLLVEIGEGQTGILTKTDLLGCYVKGAGSETTVDMFCSKELVSIEEDAMLFNALILMTRRNIERVVVKDSHSGKIKGLLELKELLYAFSNMYYSLGMKIEAANDIEELELIARDFWPLIASLEKRGAHVNDIMELVSALTGKLLKKIIELIIPPEIIPHMCFFVMGSEGREEQILKTDQDNGMVVEDEFMTPEIHEKAKEITAALLRMGYPLCKGGIMVSNAEWCQSVSGWKAKIQRWLSSENMQSSMETAIFIDSRPIAGNSTLLDSIEHLLHQGMSSNPIFFRFFAQSALQFESPLTFWGGLKKHHDGIDVKKGGIFSIVHGVRSLAVQNGIVAKNTLERIGELKQRKIIPQQLASDLPEAFKILMQLRLRARLYRLKENRVDSTPDLIKIDQLGRIERDLLREALIITKDFKLFLTDHYQILN